MKTKTYCESDVAYLVYQDFSGIPLSATIQDGEHAVEFCEYYYEYQTESHHFVCCAEAVHRHFVVPHDAQIVICVSTKPVRGAVRGRSQDTLDWVVSASGWRLERDQPLWWWVEIV